jgi:Tol biopolymer transport system component
MMMKSHKNNLVLLLVSVMILAALYPVHAQFNDFNHPELDWYTLDTEHFKVHYHEGAERTARTVAKIAEDIYTPVTEFYDWRPDGEVHFIIKDYDDNSNGAAFYYDNKVEIWAPQMTFILRGTHNWLRNVVTHEFSHMISLGASRKMPRRVPSFFLQFFNNEQEKRPDVLYGYPNVIASYPIAMTVTPMWLAEGMAQYQVPGLDYDRWDSHRDMLIRTAFLEDDPLTYDEMGVFGKNSLGNERTYNAGYAFTRYIAEHWGADALKKLTREMRKPFTLSIDDALENVTGIDATDLYNQWQQDLVEYYKARIEPIREHSQEGTLLTEKGIGNVYPAWSPDGNRIAYCGSEATDYLSRTHLTIYDTRDDTRDIIKPGVNSPLSWSPDGNRILYSRKKQGKDQSFLNDLFVYDLEQEDETRLTDGMRGVDPAWSPDGSRIVCIVQSDGTDNLVILDDKGEPVRYLSHFKYGEGVYSPSWSPDGQHIVFSQARRHGRDIKLIDLKSGAVQSLITDQGDARDPVFSPDGKRVYFSWDRSGIFNIYSIQLADSSLQQWTQVVGGAFMPSVDEEGNLVFSNFKADGYKIARIEDPQPVDQTVSRYLADTPTTNTLGLKPVNANGANGILDPVRHYDDTDLPGMAATEYDRTYGQLTLLPRLLVDHDRFKVGTYFYASDVLDKYSVTGGIALSRKLDLDAFALFELRTLSPTLFLELYGYTRNVERDITVLEDYAKVNVDIGFQILEANIGARYQFNPFLTAQASFGHGRYSSKIKDFQFQNRTWVSPLNTYFKGSRLNMSWDFNQTVPGVTSRINPAAGRKVKLDYSLEWNDFFDDFSTDNDYSTPVEVYTDYNYHRLELRWIEYLSNPFIDHHALTVDVRAGWIDKPVDSFFNFYAGGLPGLRGYSYYSIDGRKILLARLTYRFPFLSHWQKRFLHVTTDKLYLAGFFDYGDAFNTDRPDLGSFKKDAGINLRFSGFSFYGYPLALSLDAAYALDNHVYKSGVDGKEYEYGSEWRFYMTVLFDFWE